MQSVMNQEWSVYPSPPQDHGFHPSQYHHQSLNECDHDSGLQSDHRYNPYSAYNPSSSPPQHYSAISDAVDSAHWQANQQNLHASTSSAYYHSAPAPIAPISEVLSRSAGQSQLDQDWQNANNTIGDALHNLGTVERDPNGSQDGSWSSYADRVQAFDDRAAAASQVCKTKPFISKLVHLLNNPDAYADCITWDDAGTSFIVSHANPRLLQVVLPRMFQHSNIQSFTRQLNVYDFRRLPLPEVLAKLDLKASGAPHPASGDYSGWSHPRFVRDNMGSLDDMTPRPSKARLQKKLEKEAKKPKVGGR